MDNIQVEHSIFHIAIPCRDLDEASQFYVEKLGAKLARSYEDRITLNFFDHQVVCHLSPDKIDDEPDIYPRHFGITFSEKQAFDALLAGFRQRKLSFFREPFIRFEGSAEEHTCFFLRDPSNNLIEFKHYRDRRMMY